MRRFLIYSSLISICMACPAQAQVAQIATGMATLHQSMIDTTSTPFYLTRGNEVTILNANHPLWVEILRDNRHYYTHRQNLGLPAIPVVLLPPSVIAAVPREQPTGTVHYSAVGAVEGMSSEALYLRAKTWAINAFYSPKDVITTEEKDVGIIICKGYAEETIQFQAPNDRQRLYFTVKVSVKEGRYKYDLSDFYFRPSNDSNESQHSAEQCLSNAYYVNGQPNYQLMELAKVFIAKTAQLEASVKKAMQNGDDW